MRTVEKPFLFTVETEGQSVNKKFDLDKNVKLIKGIALSSNRTTLLFLRGSQRIEINGEQIYEENHESKMFMSGIGVSPDTKYKTLGDEKEDGVLAGNGEVKIQYKDTPNPEAAFEPYQVILYVKCIMK